MLIVSISGVRGVIGDGLGAREALKFAMAFGTTLGGGRVVLARDSRPSGPMLSAAVRAGLMATGCDVVDCGVLSTPGTSFLVGDLGAAGAVVITASHNPDPYNGIKLLSSRGVALNAEEGRPVRDLVESGAFAEQGTDGVGRLDVRSDAAERHAAHVLGLVDADRVRAAGFTVAVDPGNGAGGAEMRLLLEGLGCTVHAIHEAPTGRFGRPPEPVPAHLSDLAAAVRDAGAALGLALDPDADRLSLVDETGRPLGEEYTLALATRHRLTQTKGPVAANLSTSRMMDDVCREAGVPLVRTPVGEVNVAEAIEREGCVIGGEGNGGVIDPRATRVRNSLAGAALILESLSDTGRKVSELAAELPVYTMVKDKVPLGGTDPAAVFRATRDAFPGAEPDKRDGLYLAWDGGWVHVRASNTEPILRVLAEGKDAADVRAWVDRVKALTGTGG